MFLLAIDTTGREGFVALAEAASAASELHLLASVPLHGRRASEELLPSLDAMLRAHSLAPADVALICVSHGPGSFTGVRVGLCTAKAMAEALSTPIAPVSSLAALALSAPVAGGVFALLEAQRGELFLGEYERAEDGSVRRIAESVETRETLAEKLSACAEALPQLVTADAALQEFLLAAGFTPISVAPPAAEAYLSLGLRAWASGLCADAALLDANYLRRSEAELVVAPKLGIPLR